MPPTTENLPLGADKNLDYVEVVHVLIEDRIRAVKLYNKLGKHTDPTIRKLGYPTKNKLKSWYREYVQSLDLQWGYVRLRHKYSDEQK